MRGTSRGEEWCRCKVLGAGVGVSVGVMSKHWRETETETETETRGFLPTSYKWQQAPPGPQSPVETD